LRERLEHDLRQRPESAGYTLGEPVENPPLETLPGWYVPVLLDGRPASSLPWPDGSESTVAISAHLLQEVVMDEEVPPLWPRCPVHDHELIPITVDKVATWTCPSDDSVRWRIGNLEPIG
jgi:hypothetical protein